MIITWESIDCSLSLIMFDDNNKLISYIIVGKEGYCPDELFEEDTKSHKMTDIYVCDNNPFGNAIVNLKRLFWIMLGNDILFDPEILGLLND